MIRIHPLRCGTIHPPVPGKPFAQRRELPVWCYLIEHPKGRILVDTGLPHQLPHRLRHYYQPEITPEQTLLTQLSKRGLAPTDLDLVLITHLDPDHIGGLHEVAAAKEVWISEEEYYWTCRNAFSRRQPKSLWEGIPFHTFYFKGTPIGPVKHSFDLFDDGSIQLVLVPGHTFGMYAIVLENNGRRAVLSADITIENRHYSQGYVYHPRRQKEALQWLHRTIEDPCCVAALSSHDPQGNEDIIEL